MLKNSLSAGIPRAGNRMRSTDCAAKAGHI